MSFESIGNKHKEALVAMDKGNFKKALCITEELKQIEEQPYTDLTIGQILVELGTPLKRPDLIEQAITLLENRKNELKTFYGGVLHQQCLYSLGSGYGLLARYKIHKCSTVESTNADMLQHKNLLDTARTYNEDLLVLKTLDPMLTANVYVNNGVNYSYLGRIAEAFDCYDQAVKLVPNHSMALANRGVALFRLSSFTWYQKNFVLEAYQNLKKGFPGVSTESRQFFQQFLYMIEQDFPVKDMLDNPPSYPGIKIPDSNDFETFLTEFCIQNHLYLNFCSFCQKCEAAIGDTAIIKSLTFTKEEIDSKDILTARDPYVRYSAFIEEIKKDFLTCRFLFALSESPDEDYSYVFKHFHSAETFDCRITDINVQMTKISFKALYDIFDKIAVFINEFWKVGMKPRDVSFASIWYHDPNALPRDFFSKSQNRGLMALFSLYTDVRDRPKFRLLKKIRRALTHRYMRIGPVNGEEVAENMSKETLHKSTMLLAQTVRSAILHLLIAISFEEKLKPPGRYQRIQVPRKDL